MKAAIHVGSKSIPELEQLLRGPLAPTDRELVARELEQREARPLRGMFESAPADKQQGTLF